jgi:hypothetical protein
MLVTHKSPRAGVYLSVFCATAPVDALVNGTYYVNSWVQALNKFALDVDVSVSDFFTKINNI